LKYFYIVLAISALFIFSGCNEPLSTEEQPVSMQDQGETQGQGACLYAADRVHIIGLTAIKPNTKDASSAVISTYVSLHDRFDSSVKVPAVFRFELYEYVPRSSQPRGKRLVSWPEFDLSGVVVNNNYWKDFLRTYKFSLNARIDPAALKTYILQVTCVSASGKRLTDIFYLNKKEK
jgi:hypothetical protein